jgi:hypothetical protein
MQSPTRRFDKADVDDLFDQYLGQGDALFTSPSCSSSPSRDTSSSSASDSDSRQPPTLTSKKRKRKTTDSEKKERRRLQNRQAAATSREKKRKYHEDLESTIEDLNTFNENLQAQLALLLKENTTLRENRSPVTASHKPPTQKKLTSCQPHNYSNFVTDPSTTPIIFESAVLQPPQQPEMMCMMLMALHAAVLQGVLLPTILLLRMTTVNTRTSRTIFSSHKSQKAIPHLPDWNPRAALDSCHARFPDLSAPTSALRRLPLRPNSHKRFNPG